MPTLTINGKEVPFNPGQSILQAALDAREADRLAPLEFPDRERCVLHRHRPETGKAPRIVFDDRGDAVI